MTKQIDRFLVQKSRLSSVRICWNNNSRSDTSSAFSGWFQLTAWGWGKLLLVWKVSSLTCRSRGCSFFVIILNICITSSTQFCYHIITPLKRTNLIGYSFKSKTWRPVWKSSKSHCHWLQEVHWLGVLNKFSASPIEMINTICFLPITSAIHETVWCSTVQSFLPTPIQYSVIDAFFSGYSFPIQICFWMLPKLDGCFVFFLAVRLNQATSLSLPLQL